MVQSQGGTFLHKLSFIYQITSSKEEEEENEIENPTPKKNEHYIHVGK